MYIYKKNSLKVKCILSKKNWSLHYISQKKASALIDQKTDEHRPKSVIFHLMKLNHINVPKHLQRLCLL